MGEAEDEALGSCTTRGQTKAANANEDAFTDDVAAAAYIENFGLKLFSQADNEDRKAKATRFVPARASALLTDCC